MTQQGGGGLDEKVQRRKEEKQKGMKEREEWVVEDGSKREGKVYC